MIYERGSYYVCTAQWPVSTARATHFTEVTKQCFSISEKLFPAVRLFITHVNRIIKHNICKPFQNRIGKTAFKNLTNK